MAIDYWYDVFSFVNPNRHGDNPAEIFGVGTPTIHPLPGSADHIFLVGMSNLPTGVSTDSRLGASLFSKSSSPGELTLEDHYRIPTIPGLDSGYGVGVCDDRIVWADHAGRAHSAQVTSSGITQVYSVDDNIDVDTFLDAQGTTRSASLTPAVQVFSDGSSVTISAYFNVRTPAGGSNFNHRPPFLFAVYRDSSGAVDDMELLLFNDILTAHGGTLPPALDPFLGASTAAPMLSTLAGAGFQINDVAYVGWGANQRYSAPNTHRNNGFFTLVSYTPGAGFGVERIWWADTVGTTNNNTIFVEMPQSMAIDGNYVASNGRDSATRRVYLRIGTTERYNSGYAHGMKTNGDIYPHTRENSSEQYPIRKTGDTIASVLFDGVEVDIEKTQGGSPSDFGFDVSSAASDVTWVDVKSATDKFLVTDTSGWLMRGSALTPIDADPIPSSVLGFWETEESQEIPDCVHVVAMMGMQEISISKDYESWAQLRWEDRFLSYPEYIKPLNKWMINGQKSDFSGAASYLSEDGIDWTAHNVGGFMTGLLVSKWIPWLDKIVAVGSSSPGCSSVRSDDGETWTDEEIVYSSDGSAGVTEMAISDSQEMMIFSDTTGRGIRSSDGLTWEQVWPWPVHGDIQVQCYTITYSPQLDLWLMGGGFSTIPASVMISPTGDVGDWTQTQFPGWGSFSAVMASAWSPNLGRFIVGGYQGWVATSDDGGDNWDHYQMSPNSTITNLRWDPDYNMFVMSTATDLLVSPTGLSGTWTPIEDHKMAGRAVALVGLGPFCGQTGWRIGSHAM
jgi:hypothetical protein